MKRILFVTGACALVVVSNAQTFVGTGATATTFYGGALFDLKNVSASNVDLTGNFHFLSSWTGDGTYRVYTKTGSYVGSESTLANWTLWGEASTTGAGPTIWANLSLGSTKALAAGDSIGVAFFHVGGSGISVGDGAVGYRSGTGSFTDGTLTLTTGVAKGYGTSADPFNIHTLSPRTWAGEVEYTAAAAPVPEPATLGALALGAVAMLKRRKKAA